MNESPEEQRWQRKVQQTRVKQKVFVFQIFKAFREESPGETIAMTQVHCIWALMNITGLMCLLFAGSASRYSSLPRRWVIKDRDNRMANRYHTECEDLHLHSSQNQKLLQWSADGPART